MGLSKHLDAHVSIDLRRAEVGVPEHGLYEPDVSAVFQHMRGARMAECVAGAVCPYSCPVQVSFHKVAQTVLLERLAIVCEEERGLDLA
jgi:hypothetical protein